MRLPRKLNCSSFGSEVSRGAAAQTAGKSSLMSWDWVQQCIMGKQGWKSSLTNQRAWLKVGIRQKRPVDLYVFLFPSE